MKSFFSRLKVYLIGVGLGCVMVFFLFKERRDILTSWLPKQQVQIKILENLATFTESETCYLKCQDISAQQILSELENRDALVDFSKSSTRQTPKIYYIEFELDDKLVPLKFELQAQKANILIDKQAKLDCNC